MPNKITIYNHCDENEFINTVRINGLLQYNMEKTNGKLKTPDIEIVRVARDESGTIVGGAYGYTYFSSLCLEVLWVSEANRGQNIASRLLLEVENEAKEAGCVIAHTTTYSFQAPQFYIKNGYELCGEISGFPDDVKLYTLRKQLC